MTDLPAALFHRYGLAAVIVGMVAALFIWLLAHWTAAPGTQVSILWGLVSYTKSGLQPDYSGRDTAELDTANMEALIESQAREPILIEVQHGLRTREDAEKVMGRLRGARQLRELTVSESGRRIAEEAPGTYFYVLAYSIGSSFRWNRADESSEEFIRRFSEGTALRYRRELHAEVHHLSDMT